MSKEIEREGRAAMRLDVLKTSMNCARQNTERSTSFRNFESWGDLADVETLSESELLSFASREGAWVISDSTRGVTGLCRSRVDMDGRGRERRGVRL